MKDHFQRFLLDTFRPPLCASLLSRFCLEITPRLACSLPRYVPLLYVTLSCHETVFPQIFCSLSNHSQSFTPITNLFCIKVLFSWNPLEHIDFNCFTAPNGIILQSNLAINVTPQYPVKFPGGEVCRPSKVLYNFDGFFTCALTTPSCCTTTANLPSCV